MTTDSQTALRAAAEAVFAAGGRVGSRNGRAKLNEELVADARRRVAKGANITTLCEEMGVSSSALCCAVRGITWRHVPEPVTSYLQGGEHHPSSKMTWATARKARKVWAQGGVTITDLAKRFGVTRKPMSDLLSGRSWKE